MFYLYRFTFCFALLAIQFCFMANELTVLCFMFFLKILCKYFIKFFCMICKIDCSIRVFQSFGNFHVENFLYDSCIRNLFYNEITVCFYLCYICVLCMLYQTLLSAKYYYRLICLVTFQFNIHAYLFMFIHMN